MRTTVLVLGLLAAQPAFAESSLGISGAEFHFGFVQDESGDARARTSFAVDNAITEAHGLQGGLAFEDTANGTIGRVDAHLYMDPVPGQKYGFNFQFSDVDGRSLAWASAGIEGQLSLGERTAISGRTGLGKVDNDGLDYIYGGLSFVRELAPGLLVEGAFDAVEFDEAAFRAVGTAASLKVTYSPEGAFWGLWGGLSHSDLSGRDGAPSATRLSAGISIALGRLGGVDPATRPFRTYDPVAGLVRRGLQ